MKTLDYSDESKDIQLKSERIRAIRHIQATIEDDRCMDSLIVPNLDKVMEMVEKNIFRPLPNIKRLDLDKRETGIEQEEVVDPAWPYLQGVFEIFLMILANDKVEAKTLKSYCTPQFIQEFLGLFESEDPVERDILKNILHKLYSKVSTITISILLFSTSNGRNLDVVEIPLAQPIQFNSRLRVCDS